MHKQDLRLKYKNIRKYITNKEHKIDKLYARILNDTKYLESKKIALFVGFNDEIETEELIKIMLADNKCICLPYIDGKTMSFHKINSLDELIKNHMGIKEPPCTNELIEVDKIDLMYVPGLCFDCHGYRVGYGGGYYDRYLKDCDIYTIGIGFHEQYLANELIENDSYDIKLKAFISDEIYIIFE